MPGVWQPSGGGTKAPSKPPKDLVAAITKGNARQAEQIARGYNFSDKNIQAFKILAGQVKPGGLGARFESDLKSSVTGIPRGLAGIAKQGGQEIANPFLHAARGELTLRDIPIGGQIEALGESAITGKEVKGHPLTSGLGESFHRTGARLSNPSKLVKDYSAHPLNAPLEDIANASIVLGPLAKAAKLGGFERTAAALAKTGEVTGKVAQGPFLPVSGLARGANKVLGRAGAKVTESEMLRPALEALRLTPEARATRGVLRVGVDEAGAATNRTVRVARQIEKVLPSKAEQEAMLTVGQGEATALATMREHLPNGFATFVQKQFGGGLSVEGANLAADVVSGRNPELAGRVEEGLRLGAVGRAGREESYLARGPESRVEQTGMEPLSATGEAPARLRPVLNVNQAVASELRNQVTHLESQGLGLSSGLLTKAADEIPTTLEGLRAGGVDPDHFIHVQIGSSPASRGGRAVNADRLPRVAKPRSAWYRGMIATVDRTVRAQAQGEIAELRSGIQIQTAHRLAELPFVKKVGDLGLEVTPGLRGELDQAGYVPWDPRSPFEIPGTITPETTVLPKAVFDSFRTYNVPKNWEKVAGVFYDPLTKAFKTAVLPLSLSWQVGNLVGNFLMATIGGGVNPVTLARNITKSIAEYRKTGEFIGPERLFSSGATHETLDYLSGNGKSPGWLTRHHLNPVQGGYRINQLVDDVGRSAVYMAKKGRGYSDELALRQALRAMGDFTNMSPFERSVVRRVIPFYSWQKHMMKLALTLPVEHPLRTAWTLHLADLYGQPGPDNEWLNLLPTYLRSAVPLGGGNVLQASNLFPFSTPFGLATDIGQNLSPQVKLLLANLPGSPARGINAFTGRPYTRPPGTARTDEMGRELPTAPSILQQLRGIPPQLRLLDQLTGRNDVARYESGDKVLVAGPNGTKVPIKTPQSSFTAISRALGVPIRSEKDLQGIIQSIIANKAKTVKAHIPTSPRPSHSTGGGVWHG